MRYESINEKDNTEINTRLPLDKLKLNWIKKNKEYHLWWDKQSARGRLALNESKEWNVDVKMGLQVITVALGGDSWTLLYSWCSWYQVEKIVARSASHWFG